MSVSRDALELFHYPAEPHIRQFGPGGYVNPRSFKPWLRVEFGYRCVYCLIRENWFPIGDEAFSVDHLVPRSLYPDGLCDYTNLVYSCCRCNSAKNDIEGVVDPCLKAYFDHLEVNGNGEIAAKSSEGGDLIEICQLNRDELCEFRERMIRLYDVLSQREDESARALFAKYFGPPSNPPNLARLRPPNGKC